jgi:DNA-binding transcriptional regulator YiaG
MGATFMTMTATAPAPTMAPADLLIGLRERVPLTEVQIARATGADEQTVHTWLERRRAPSTEHARRLTELVAFVEEMARNLTGETLVGWWLDGNVDFLSGANPLDEIAAGRYEDMIGYALGLSHGVFT